MPQDLLDLPRGSVAAADGTVLAVANRLGLDALGVEKNRKRAEEARALVVRSDEV